MPESQQSARLPEVCGQHRELCHHGNYNADTTDALLLHWETREDLAFCRGIEVAGLSRTSVHSIAAAGCKDVERLSSIRFSGYADLVIQAFRIF